MSDPSTQGSLPKRKLWHSASTDATSSQNAADKGPPVTIRYLPDNTTMALPPLPPIGHAVCNEIKILKCHAIYEGSFVGFL